MQFINGLCEIHEKYEGFIIDLWGVIHNGYQVFPQVLECLLAIKQLNKPVIFLTNSSQRKFRMVEHLTELGISPELYHELHSSGEDVFEYLQESPPQGNCFVLGQPGDWAREKELQLTFTSHIEEASFILNTNPSATTSTQFDDILTPAAAHNIPMFCVNPDLTALHGTEQRLCAGSIAQRYEELGGEVTYHGKPHARVYKRALEKLGGLSAANVLATGDSLRTDIAGAHKAGMDGLLVMSGLEGNALNILDHSFLPEEKIMMHCVGKNHKPEYICSSFKW